MASKKNAPPAPQSGSPRNGRPPVKRAKADGAGAANAAKIERADGGHAPDVAPPSPPFPVVGLGASAGGLGALEAFFAAMPPDSGMAFVVLMHHHTGQRSLLAELLGRKTAMPVLEVSERTRVAPNHVYTVKPGYVVAIVDGVLVPSEITTAGGLPTPMPIDYFFRSLAADQRDRAIAIVLSGTGTDGTLGVKDVKGELGIVLAQDEQSAQYPGMPQSAIRTSLVDFVLPVTEMPRQILEYRDALLAGRPAAKIAVEPRSETLQEIFALIRERTGHDFSHYKESTVRRRIERRMNVHHLDSARRYVRYVQANPAEIEILFRDLLIGVTSFFRDPEAWTALEESLLKLLAGKPDDHVVRAWVAGCSTGEEAYSLAILLRECMDSLRRSLSVQIFATDLDATAIDVARAGVYPPGIVNDLSPQRLARFFTQEDDSFRVKKEVRELIVFAPQNIIADPPFTKLDLLCCRNLLIYLDGELQGRLVPMFHYALRPNGILFLGSSESIGNFANLFAPLDKKWKTFRRQEVPFGSYVAEIHGARAELGPPIPPRAAAVRAATEVSYTQMAERTLLKELVPPTVFVQERGDVVHIHGRTGLFLEPAQGAQSSANIFNMAREGLQISLAAAMRQAATEDREIVHRGVQVKAHGGVVSLDLRVSRLKEPEPLRGLFRITFEHAEPARRGEGGAAEGALESKPPGRILELERELQYTKESHQSTIEELETANEELKSTNEELQSTNEELQSANEELETSKEEMQSLNEELQTVNAELHGKVDELSRINNDMKNLLNGTDIATIFLDNELNIKRFTEQAKKVIRLIPSDVGRPIGDLVSTLHYDRLVDDAREVLRTLVFKEIEVQGEGNASYLMRILPYRTTENVIDGLVLTFVDVTTVRTLLQNQQRLIEALSHSRTSAFGNDRALRYRWSVGSVLGRDLRDVEGKTDAEVFGAGAANLVDVKRRVLESQRAERARVDVVIGGRTRSYDVYVEPERAPSGEVIGVACVATDLTPPETAP